MRIVDIFCDNRTYKSHYIIENISDLMEYHKTIRMCSLSKINGDFDKNIYVEPLANAAYNIKKIHTDFGMLDNKKNSSSSKLILDNLIQEIYINQINSVNKGYKLAINPKGGYFEIPKNATIVDIDIK